MMQFVGIHQRKMVMMSSPKNHNNSRQNNINNEQQDYKSSSTSEKGCSYYCKKGNEYCHNHSYGYCVIFEEV